FQFPAAAGFGPQFIWLDTGVFRRAQGLFYEASTLGNFCAFFLEMALIALFQSGGARPVRSAYLIAGGIVLAAALVLSYSRASLLNLAIALAVLLWLNRRRIRFGRLLMVTGILVAAATVFSVVVFPEFSRAYW